MENYKVLLTKYFQNPTNDFEKVEKLLADHSIKKLDELKPLLDYLTEEYISKKYSVEEHDHLDTISNIVNNLISFQLNPSYEISISEKEKEYYRQMEEQQEWEMKMEEASENETIKNISEALNSGEQVTINVNILTTAMYEANINLTEEDYYTVPKHIECSCKRCDIKLVPYRDIYTIGDWKNRFFCTQCGYTFFDFPKEELEEMFGLLK